MNRFRIFEWFFTKEEKEEYDSPLELLDERLELMERDHQDLINRFFELDKKVDDISKSLLDIQRSQHQKE
jgi:hypothetical protein